jgi:hypothetical protein
MTDLPEDDPDAAGGIAADDAGGSALGRNVGETAGGHESFGVGSEGPAGAEDGSGPADVAADDAGVTAGLLRRPERGGG